MAPADAPAGFRELAPAKVNLALHVTGRRADGYHELDSLVVFLRLGDLLEAVPAERLTLSVEGPFAAGLTAGPENLVLRAAAMIRPAGRGAALRLAKALPVASGLGGGSADAAAALRLLARVWGVATPAPATTVTLGADVPVCLAGRPARMRGVGEALDPVTLPAFWLVLANPGVAVATAAAYAGLERRDNAPLEPPPRGLGAAALVEWLVRQRNDLEPPALRLAPPIAEARAALAAQAGCLLARMSGSGATCFGLFAAATEAEAAAAAIARARPGWWVAAAPTE
ncbi:4-(cytidine 5'-diphospho)-2-C-methyl-D-erythritol kinase [Amaricoccus sp.]|uniref:4-(cytidine 5'-diphospho)-2-C-methyl-D-erythritol kinase n=1 Tax=Amaricoccus sp. TaxID=1872485 RepID=UPI001B5CA28F|nr:4-(cytidine 5'-diphospho)-2-C-methyl-D-erythritol kinase [Amaricoccus sp.]MBP7242231.1 4-(cytidine 5'-diphospho)-2-C-methyl-D-erythritol kinase [Amaricoccus sp.]